MAFVRQGYPDLPRHALVVCASLLTNPINLGMLCRTAEAFRLESLVVDDLAVVDDRAFRQGAVNTHRWQPVAACPAADLPGWLAQRRAQGYGLVALHRQPQAVPLPALRFPQRTVLVLGRELTGIPEAVLARCDQTVAIPQYGLVESLNVQTAAALAIYGYIGQWGMAPAP